MTNSKRSRQKSKPEKPYPDFPLTPHPSGRWCKKIRGKLHYFGPLDDPDGALQRYLDTKDDLHAGRTPRVTGDGLTVADLCNRFLTAKRNRLDTGEITERTFKDYYRTCDRIVSVFGRNRRVDDLAADDFERLRAEIAKAWGPVALGNEIQRIRTVFKFAWDDSLIEQPVRFGSGFTKPNRKTIRKARQANGQRMLEAEEIRRMLDAADQPLRAMILLGINGGLGQSDISAMPQSALDLDNGWLDYPRVKTAVERRIPLWPETVEAVREALQSRPEPKAEADMDLCFITKYGNRWVNTTRNGSPDDGIGKEFIKLLKRLDMKRPRVSFYALRHSFETIAGESRDQVAVDAIMGHVDNSMAGAYRERISDERLTAVVETVREWLWPEGGRGDD